MKNLSPANLRGDKYQTLGRISLITGSTCLAAAGLMAAFEMESYLSIVALGLACFLAWFINRIGHPQFSAAVLVASLLAAVEYNLLQGYGIHDVSITAWPAIIFFVGLFFGSRTIPYITLVTIGLIGATRFVPNAYHFAGSADTGDLIMMVLIIASFSLIGYLIIRGNEQAGAAVVSSEARYRLQYENSPVGLFRMTGDGQILLANPRLARMLGYASIAEFPTGSLAKAGFLAHDRDRADFLERMQKTGEVNGLESTWTAKDGAAIHVRITASLTFGADQYPLIFDGIVEDISEQRRLAEAYRRSEAQYRSMVETANEGVVVLDREHRVTMVNRQMAAMLGVALEDLLGQEFGTLLFQEAQADRQAFLEAQTQGHNAVFECCLRRGDGSRLWTILSTTVFTDADGALDGAFAMITDITERKQAETALRLSEEKFAKAFRMNPAAIILARSSDGRVIEINDTFSRLLGYPPEEIVGGTSLDQDVWVDLADRDRLFENLGEGTVRTNVEARFYTKDQRVITCLCSFERVEIEGEAHTLGVLEDISERKAADASLQASNQQLNSILENLQDAYFQADTAGNFTFVNMKAAKQSGFESAEDMLGTPVRDMFADPADQDVILEELRRAGKVADWYGAAKRKDGATFWISLNVQFVCAENGQVTGIEGVMRDISERRAAENALRENHALLSQFVSHSPIYCYIKEVHPTHGLVLQASENFVEMIGITGSAMVGMTTAELFPPDFAARVTAEDWTVVSTGNILRVDEDLNGRSYETIKFPIQLGEKTLMAGYSFDMTERRRAEASIRQRNAELTALNQIGQSLSKLGEPAQILERIFTEIGKIMDNRNFYITLFDKETQYLTFPVYTVDGERLMGRGRPLENGVTDYILRSNQPFLAHGRITDLRDQLGFTLRGRPPLSFLGVPIDKDGEAIGVIALQNFDYENVYDAHHLELLTTIAAQASSSLENARLFHAVQQELEERRRAEMSLVEARTLTDAIVESTSDMIWSVDPVSFGLFFFNLGLSDYFWKTRGLRIRSGMGLEELYPSDDYVQLWRGYYQRALQGGTYTVEYKTFSGTGTLQLTFNQLRRSGRVFGISIFGKDITERKRAEERVRSSEKKYRELFEVNKDGIAIFPIQGHGPPGNFIEVNRAAPAMLGYTRAEMLQMTPMMLEPYTTIEKMKARAEGLNKGVAINFETTLLHKNGHPVAAEFSSQIIDYEGQPAVMNIVRDVSERKQRERELQAIAALSTALRTAVARAEMLPAIVEKLVSLLECDAIAAELVDPLTGDSSVEAAFGAWAGMVGQRHAPDTGLNAQIIQTRHPYYNNEFHKRRDPGIFIGDIHAITGVPLIALDQLIGILWMGRRTDIPESEVRLLEAVADMTANALHRATLHERTQKYAADLTRAYDTTLEGWAHALELRDQETEGHARHVVKLTMELAGVMGVAESEMEHIRRGALLHDIGKMGIPDSVLLKPGTLNDREWEIMRRHPEYAYQLLQPIEYLRPALDIPYCHHEKWDGSGYPQALHGQAIPLAARLFAVVDVWDALLSDRPYRKAWTREQVRSHIIERSGSHFDPQVVQAFLPMVAWAE